MSRIFKILRIIGFLTISLTLSHVSSHEVKCIQKVNGNIHVCNYTAKWKTLRACCYNSELDYHYCCPINEYRSMSHGKRIGGASFAAAVIIFLILMLCFLSNRCPIRRAISKRCPNSDEQVSSDVERI